jgi:uncharacterized integral membrane protein
MAIFLASILTGFWLIAIAIVAMQNAELVTLSFLFFQSVKMPFGFVFACSVAAGLVAGGLWQLWWPVKTKKKQRRPRTNNQT